MSHELKAKISSLVQAPRRTHHLGNGENVVDQQATAFKSIAESFSSIAESFSQMASTLTGGSQMLNYEQASIATTLGTSKLETMVSNGRFVEGRHYIKEGTRVLFHKNLGELMFEDHANKHQDSPEAKKAKLMPITERRSANNNHAGFNLDYR